MPPFLTTRLGSSNSITTTAMGRLPECWGHRGASARFPENTLASFEAAIRDGAEGIESDVHVSADNVVLMFHDPALERTTDSSGLIRERNWFGEDGMEHVRTVKQPKQAIPTFAETIGLLMKPENHHVQFNVDVKVQNDAERLFALMHKIITSHPNWETLLAPRLVLGLWHPAFIPFAKEKLGYCRRSYLGNSLSVARKYFWKECETFSVEFSALSTGDGERFRRECKEAGKKVMVWTVNEPAHLMEAARWGIDIIITDHTRRWLDMRTALQENTAVSTKYSRSFLWTSFDFYAPVINARAKLATMSLQKSKGSFDVAFPRAIEATA